MSFINHFAMALNGKLLTCSQPRLHSMFQDLWHIEQAAAEPAEREETVRTRRPPHGSRERRTLVVTMVTSLKIVIPIVSALMLIQTHSSHLTI